MKNWLSHTRNMVVGLENCDLDDETYHVPCYSSLEPLMRSIERVGVLCKPVMQERLNGRLIPLLGRRRLKAARGLGMTEMPVSILPRDISEAECYELAFWDNIGHRELELPSKAFVVARLLEVFPRTDVASRFLSVLGITPWGPRIEELKLLAQLDREISSLLAAGRLKEKTALTIARISGLDQKVCVRLLDELKPNVNKAHELIAGLFDLSVTKGCGIDEIVQGSGIAGIIESNDSSPHEKIDMLRSWLKRMRCPELYQDELEFQEWLRRQPLPENVSIKPQQAFEDPGCTIEIRLQSKSEVPNLLRNLELMPF
ncbi:MAG: ParB family transcriptional regulator, chromosome partitioning protein [Thermodesulfobacteriota bacterium]|nr:ParB family transcriptional regulator, chromosome partitioning protein [Thermodesulfobacteriota bacterium]